MQKICAFALCLGFASPALAQVVGRFASVQGGATVMGSDGSKTPAKVGANIRLGDIIETSATGRTKLLFADGSVMNLGDDSRLRITKFLYDPNEGREGFLELLKGAVRAWVTKLRTTKNKFEVQTPTAVAGVRGTDWAIRETRNGAQIIVFGGEVAVRSLSLGLSGECLAREGQTCVVRPGTGAGKSENATPQLKAIFRGMTRVAARMEHEGSKLASLMMVRIARLDAFKPKFQRVLSGGAGQSATSRFTGSRPEGNIPGTGTFGDTTQPARLIPLQVLTSVRPNF